MTVPKKRWICVVLPLWVYGAFWAAQLVVLAALKLFVWLGVSFEEVHQATFNAAASILTYVLALVIAIFVPLVIYRQRTSLKDVGVTGWPSWLDIVMTPLMFIVYMIGSAIFVAIMAKILPVGVVDLAQRQQLPFSQTMLLTPWHMFLAFFTLVVLAPIAEELLFRGYLYGKLRKYVSTWMAVLSTSLLFGIAHFWAPGSPLQWAVMFDTFVLSIFMCLAREYTGAIWVGVLMHMVKNGLAFYLLFVNPQAIEQINAIMLHI